MFNSPSVLTALAPPSPAPSASATGGTWPPRVPRRGLKRPRGLWKARRRLDPATTATASSLTQHQHHHLSRTPGSGGAKSSCSGRGSDTDREMEESCGEGEGEEEEDGEEEDGGDDMSQNSNSSKRQRRDSGSGRSSSSNIHIDNYNYNRNTSSNANGIPMELWAVFVDSETDVGLPLTLGGMADSTVGHGTPLPLPVPLPGDNTDIDIRQRAESLICNSVTTSIAERTPTMTTTTTKEEFEYKDWLVIKETLACASELCDREDPSGAIPLLRAVVHKSHAFLLRFPDPALFFSRPLSQPSSRRSRSSSPDSAPWSRRSTTPDSDTTSHHSHPIESPTALHAVLGVALFLLGNIIAQNPSLALAREPTSPSPYWLAALDVLNAGDNLPSQTNGAHAYDDASARSGSADDWRVAIAWGRTLVALAHEATNRSPSASSPSPPPSPATARAYLPPASPHSPTSPSASSNTPPRYQPRSPLAAITTLRPPGLSHAARASASELLTLAADQFSRGIFHMPHNNHQPHYHHPQHPQHHHPNINRTLSSSPCSSSPASPSATEAAAAAQRPYILYTLASEVLAVAERLDDTEARRRWAAWADAVFLQMHMEADVDAWRARVGVARGRCWLVIGSAHADEMEDALERGDASVLLGKEAEVARTGLSNAVEFFDRARGSASTESSEPSLVNMRPLLAEALLSLANITTDENAREAFYMRAQAEGDDMLLARELGGGGPVTLRPTRSRREHALSTRTPRSRSRTDVRMDES